MITFVEWREIGHVKRMLMDCQSVLVDHRLLMLSMLRIGLRFTLSLIWSGLLIKWIDAQSMSILNS